MFESIATSNGQIAVADATRAKNLCWASLNANFPLLRGCPDRHLLNYIFSLIAYYVKSVLFLSLSYTETIMLPIVGNDPTNYSS